MTEEGLAESEKLLLDMHNRGIVHETGSKTLHELLQLSKISLEQLTSILRKHEESGYVKSFTDSAGSKKYYLTGMGMIRVSSAFT